MLLEATRLAFGLIILVFHRRIAQFILVREQALVVLFRQRGVPLPAAPTQNAAFTIYFLVGVFVCLLQCARIWMLLHR